VAAGPARKVSMGALANTIVKLNHGMYVLLSVLLALAFVTMVAGGILGTELPACIGTNASPYWLLTELIDIASPNPFALAILSFLIAASVLPFTTLCVRESALLIAQSPLSRGKFLATSYLMAAGIAAAPVVAALLIWSLVVPVIMPYTAVTPAALGGAAAALTALFTIPTAIFGVSLAAIVSSRLNFTHTAAILFMVAYLIVGPFLLAAVESLVGPKLLYVAAAICPGTGLAYYVSRAFGFYIRATAANQGVAGPIYLNLNPLTCLTISLASLALVTAAAVVLFTRYAEVRGA